VCAECLVARVFLNRNVVSVIGFRNTLPSTVGLRKHSWTPYGLGYPVHLSCEYPFDRVSAHYALPDIYLAGGCQQLAYMEHRSRHRRKLMAALYVFFIKGHSTCCLLHSTLWHPLHHFFTEAYRPVLQCFKALQSGQMYCNQVFLNCFVGCQVFH
jgi:dTDP-4-amino-4,6-dideoxygalactose transaminase